MRPQNTSHIRLITSLACLCVLAFFTSQVSATPVAVLAGDERGQGLARKRGTECLVIVPAHLLPPPVRRTRAEFTVVGPGGARGSAAFVEQIGTEDDDVAILRMTENERFVCDTSEAPTLKSKQAAVLALRSENGDLQFGPVDVVAQAGKTLEIEPRSDFFTVQRSMSGAVLIEAGRSRGVLVSAATQDNDLAFVRSIDYIAGLTGTWAKDPAEDVSSIKDALDIISQAIETRPAGDIGQIAAAETLTREGSPLEGLDLGGLSLENAFLANARLKGSRFYVSTLDNADLTGADLTLTRFRYADLRAIRADEATLTNARFTFANAPKARFRNASGEASGWLVANLPQADFEGADLKGAHFIFANLEGANFRGADLTNATFAGANLRGAVFEGAIMKNTDLTDARGSIAGFSPDQRSGLCARRVDEDLWRIRFEIIPVDQEGDRTSPNATEAQVATSLDKFAEGRLDPCKPVAEPDFEPIWSHGYANQYYTRTIRLVVADGLRKGEIREERIRRNVVKRIALQNQLLGYCNRLSDGSPTLRDDLTCPRGIEENVAPDPIAQPRDDAKERLALLKRELTAREEPDAAWLLRPPHMMIRFDKEAKGRYLSGEGPYHLALPTRPGSYYRPDFESPIGSFDGPMIGALRRYGVKQLENLPKKTVTLRQPDGPDLSACKPEECSSAVPLRFAGLALTPDDWSRIEKRFGIKQERWPTVLMLGQTIVLSRLPKSALILGDKPELVRSVRAANQSLLRRALNEPVKTQMKLEVHLKDAAVLRRKPRSQRPPISRRGWRDRVNKETNGAYTAPWERDPFDGESETLTVLIVERIELETGLVGLEWSQAKGFQSTLE